MVRPLSLDAPQSRVRTGVHMAMSILSGKIGVPFLTFSRESGTLNRNRNVFSTSFQNAGTVMKDKNLLGFIVIDLLLAAGIVWGLAKGYKLLGYGLLVYFIINTLAIVLKVTGNKKDGGDQ